MKTTVAVTALKVIESAQPGFGIARSLSEAGFRVIGVDDAPFTPAVVSPDFDRVVCVPSLRTENLTRLRSELSRLRRQFGVETVIPGYDRDVYVLASLDRSLRADGLKCLLPTVDSLRRSSKVHLSSLIRDGILVPDTVIVSRLSEIPSAVKQLGLPVVCKGIVKDALVAFSALEAQLHVRRLRTIWGGGSGPIILQRFIRGQACCVVGVADSEHKVCNSVTMRKLGIDSKGSTWCGYSLHDKRLERLTAHMCELLSWTGPFEAEFIVSSEGCPILLEWNPRFPGWIHFATHLGVNLPEQTVRLALGMPVQKKRTYAHNVAFVRSVSEVFLPLSRLTRLLK